jgi:hypothetical protein
VCLADIDCCGGTCNIPTGGTKGTCAPPPTGNANCQMPDGVVCGGTVATNDAAGTTCGGSCCSRLCAPYGPTGVYVCQPATGCHIVGDLCRHDSDCCGSAAGPPPYPNGGFATCTANDGGLGICSNPSGCKPNGDVCKLPTTSCNATCDCCSGHLVTDAGGGGPCQKVCRQDELGVPRCSLPSCVNTDGLCATSADCCTTDAGASIPCVPPADGGPGGVCYNAVCVPTTGYCSVNADCCPGNVCTIPLGATRGTCNSSTPPPPPPSDAGPPPEGGVDAAPPPDSGPPPPPPCSLYGQLCPPTCCNGIPCIGGRCISP